MKKLLILIILLLTTNLLSSCRTSDAVFLIGLSDEVNKENPQYQIESKYIYRIQSDSKDKVYILNDIRKIITLEKSKSNLLELKNENDELIDKVSSFEIYKDKLIISDYNRKSFHIYSINKGYSLIQSNTLDEIFKGAGLFSIAYLENNEIIFSYDTGKIYKFNLISGETE